MSHSTRSPHDIHVVRETMGMSTIVVFRNLFAGDEAAARVRTSGSGSLREALGSVAPIAGARDTILGLRRSGVRVCLTTGFSAVLRDAVLEALGWQGSRRPHAHTGGSCRRSGSAASGTSILTAALRLGVDDVRHIAVVGATTNDLVAGWRSGASLVAGVLTGAHTRTTLEAAPHTHLCDSIVEVRQEFVRFT